MHIKHKNASLSVAKVELSELTLNKYIMRKIDSVLSLLYSLSKSEKKHISSQLIKGNENKDYLIIYNLIIKDKCIDVPLIKSEFTKRRKSASFEITVHYLYEKILDTLLLLRRKKDIMYDFFQKISKVRMLYDKSLFFECFNLLSEVIEDAKKYENNEIVLLASRIELEYLLRLNFPNLTEQELYHKHYRQVDAIKNIRKITEQASLYDLLRYRIIYKGNVRTQKQKQDMNDLMVSELYLSASFQGENNFEITKNHQLFQASYLIAIGDYQSALHSFKELNRLFEDNPQFWANPPIYYLSVLEGVLHSLRFTGNYTEMEYFIKKLEDLSDHSSLEFKINVTCLIFQYKIFPWLDQGDFSESKKIINQYHSTLFQKDTLLNSMRKCELTLYTALIYIGSKEYVKARKLINNTLIGRNLESLPIMRTIRLVRLIIYYELRDMDMVEYGAQALKRNLSLKREQSFQTEHIMLWFLKKKDIPSLSKDREILWKRLKPTLDHLHNDRFEKQVLFIFDFTAWIEAKILKKDISEVIKEHFEDRKDNNQILN